MTNPKIVVTPEQADCVQMLAALYENYENAANPSMVRTLIWSNLEQLNKLVNEQSAAAVVVAQG